MRKNYFFTVIAATTLLVSCGETKKSDEVPAESAPNVQSVDTKGLKIAYYQMDSLKSQFTYYKNEEARISKKSKVFENTMMARQKSLMALNQKYQEGLAGKGVTDPNELMKLEENLQRQDRQLQVYQQEEGAKIQEEANAFSVAAQKKVDAAAAKYCKKYGIDILLTHGAGGQLGFINEKMDVSKSFIEFLNKEQSDLEKDLGM